METKTDLGSNVTRMIYFGLFGVLGRRSVALPSLSDVPFEIAWLDLDGTFLGTEAVVPFLAPKLCTQDKVLGWPILWFHCESRRNSGFRMKQQPQ